MHIPKNLLRAGGIVHFNKIKLSISSIINIISYLHNGKINIKIFETLLLTIIKPRDNKLHEIKRNHLLSVIMEYEDKVESYKPSPVYFINIGHYSDKFRQLDDEGLYPRIEETQIFITKQKELELLYNNILLLQEEVKEKENQIKINKLLFKEAFFKQKFKKLRDRLYTSDSTEIYCRECIFTVKRTTTTSARWGQKFYNANHTTIEPYIRNNYIHKYNKKTREILKLHKQQNMLKEKLIKLDIRKYKTRHTFNLELLHTIRFLKIECDSIGQSIDQHNKIAEGILKQCVPTLKPIHENITLETDVCELEERITRYIARYIMVISECETNYSNLKKSILKDIKDKEDKETKKNSQKEFRQSRKNEKKERKEGKLLNEETNMGGLFKRCLTEIQKCIK
jgi:hypothetical protein